MTTHKAAPKRLGTSQSARPASRAGLDDGSPLRPRTTTPGAGSLFSLDGCSRPASRAEPLDIFDMGALARLRERSPGGPRSPESRPESRPASCEAGLEAGTMGLVDGNSAGIENGSGATGTQVPRTPQKNGTAHRDSRAAPLHHHLRTDTEDDFSDSEKIANLDTSLAEEMQAVPQEGTVLRRVDDWISDLESKYAGLGLDPASTEHADSSSKTTPENDPKILKNNVRKFLIGVPFPAWDGDDTPIELPETPPTPPPVFHDYEPDLLRADGEPEDADADDRDAGARLVRAYANSCLKHSKTALPQVVEALSLRRAETLAMTNCSIADGGIAALGPFLGELKGLTALDLSSNMIFDHGATALAKALKPCVTLTSLQLDYNKIGTYGATALAGHFKLKRCNLTYLSVRQNQLSDHAVSEIVAGVAVRKKIVWLVLSYNAVGQQSCSALANLLMTSRTLERLECHWGHMRGQGAVEFADALKYARGLKHLDVGWNGFGDIRALYPKFPGSSPCSELGESLKNKDWPIEYLDISHNRMSEKAAFLIAGPLEYNKSLKKLIMDGNPVGQGGCRRIMNSCLGFKNSGLEQEKSENMVEVSLKDCSFGMVSADSFDPAEPAGEYCFDMSEPLSRLVVRDLLKIEAMGKGQFQRLTVTLDLDYDTDEPNPKNYNLKKMVDFDREADIPERGELYFRFVSLRKPPWAGGDTELSHTVFESLKEHFKNNSKPLAGEHRLGKIEFLKVLMTADTIFSSKQAEELIVLLLTSDEKVQFMAEIYHKFAEPDGNRVVGKKFLTDAEYKRLMKLLGPTAFAFTPNNPTGHHRLDLSIKEERDVGIKILDARNGNEDYLEAFRKKYSTHAGGPRDHIELCWRNATMNGEHIQYERHLALPRSGTMELDFVSILKPQDIDPRVQAIPNSEWETFMSGLNETESLFEVVGEFRELSNTRVFKCSHIRDMLWKLDEMAQKFRLENDPEAPPAKESGAGRPKERSLTVQKYRVEIFIIAYARTIDYLGFFGIYGMFKIDLSRPERHMLLERIGLINMFHPDMACDYYELDFGDKQQRWIMQEIVHMAIAEPGKNCEDETYNDMDFPMPVTWSKDLPRSGFFSCFYCREQDTITRVCENANQRHPGCVSTDVQPQPPLDGKSPPRWVYEAKCRIIKNKMMDKFSNVKACFNAIDKDGGGTVDRKELAGGLFRELATLFKVVDDDESNSIEFHELEKFWNFW